MLETYCTSESVISFRFFLSHDLLLLLLLLLLHLLLLCILAKSGQASQIYFYFVISPIFPFVLSMCAQANFLDLFYTVTHVKYLSHLPTHVNSLIYVSPSHPCSNFQKLPCHHIVPVLVSMQVLPSQFQSPLPWIYEDLCINHFLSLCCSFLSVHRNHVVVRNSLRVTTTCFCKNPINQITSCPILQLWTQ